MLTYDVVIVGSGIAGMTCAIYLKRNGRKVLIVEGDVPGGQLNRSFLIENYPGYVKIDGPSLAMNVFDQVSKLGVDFCYEEVTEIDLVGKIAKTKNKEFGYKYLVYATGRRPKGLELVNELELVGRGLSFCALCDGSLYKDGLCLVVGGGNSAVEEAIYLAKICKKVILVHRRDVFRASLDLVREMNAMENIECLLNEEVKEYIVADGKLVGVILKSGKEIIVDGVFLSIGSVPCSELLDVTKENGYIVVDRNYETSVSDVYAIGDVIKKDVYQLTTAVSDATVAANSILKKQVV